ncbi:MAG: alpha/beta fold hydrolase [Ktedonobacteraceae bacterium]
MPFLPTLHTTLYYDIFEPNFTSRQQFTQEVLLLHGFASTPVSDFSGQIPSLRTRYRIIAPHLHGYGRSSPRERYPLSYYRDDVGDMIALLDALAIKQVHVLGFSDGAIVSLLLAALHPRRVKALAVLGAQPTVSQEDAAGIRHWLLENSFSAELQAQLAEQHGEPYWRTLPAMYVAGQEELVIAGGVLITDEELAAISCPTLIMHGKRDRIVPASYASTLAAHIPHSQLLLLDAGHAAHVRCAQEYTAAVMDFFAAADQL